MLCRRFNKILYIPSPISRSSQYRCSIVFRSKCLWIHSLLTALKTDPMSSHRLRLIFRDLRVTRLWNAWFRTHLVSSVVKRCRRDRGVRDMLAVFRHSLFRPSRTFLLSATAAYKSNSDDNIIPGPCRVDISDEEIASLVDDLDGVDELSRKTLFCEGCGRRLIIDKQQPGVLYCTCPDAKPPGASEDGWVPYMEAEDVVIWRKEYKAGGLYAYKVYGRYKDLMALDLATIQLDGTYRMSWDDAVAALAVIERAANGIRSQSVMHWEVLWPRFFSNRDYVYIRRHKQFSVRTRCLAYKEAIFNPEEPRPCGRERPSVHSHAKRKAIANELKEAREKAAGEEKLNKVYVIVSRSCTHPSVPESSSVVRVHEYWSNMVVRSLDGADKVGTEFVLTYYDEPSVGGMPSGVSAWATSRAAPVFLAKMRRAAALYAAWRHRHPMTFPEFEPFGADGGGTKPDQKKQEKKEEKKEEIVILTPKKEEPVILKPKKEEPFILKPTKPTEGPLEVMCLDKSTQTEPEPAPRVKVKERAIPGQKVFEGEPKIITGVKAEVNRDVRQCGASEEEVKVEETPTAQSKDDPSYGKPENEEEVIAELEGEAQKSSWWRYLYPFYYFV